MGKLKLVAISGWKKSGKDMLADHLVRAFGAVRVAFADPLKDRVAEEFDIPRWWLDNQDYKERPLMMYPVEPQDAFSVAIAKLMFGEFRSVQGLRPDGFSIAEDGSNFHGTFNDRGFNGEILPGSILHDDLFWTPRALAIFKGSGNRAVTSKYWVTQAIKKIEEASTNEVRAALARGDKDYVPVVVMSDVRFRSEVNQLREHFGKELTTVRVNRFDTCESTDASERDLDDAKFDYVLENRGTKEEALYKIAQAANLRW